MANDKIKKDSYIFPQFVGNAMSKVTMRTQLESGMLSMTFMMFGLILLGIYFVVYGMFPWYVKVLMVINLIAGFFMMMSYLVTSFQQYRTLMESQEIMLQIQTDEKEVKHGKETN